MEEEAQAAGVAEDGKDTEKNEGEALMMQRVHHNPADWEHGMEQGTSVM